ncbi:MAG: metallophosphatase domain-containing protein [Saprospiraceae bacterium]|nr:metallophosphatase domain-containing protein [Saprospiraceae bacterium]
MQFVAISDTHGLHRKLKIPEGDVIIHAGDFCAFENEELMHDFFDWYQDLDFDTKILIGGNHDFFAAKQSRKFQQLLPKNITYLNDSGMTIDGINIWGSPVQPDLVGWAFGKRRGLEMKAHWDLIPKDTDLLITHTPPFGILDKSSSRRALGCEELKKKLDYLDLQVHIFGHIHASYGEQLIGKTKYINASNMDSKKGLVNPPIAFDL